MTTSIVIDIQKEKALHRQQH